MRNEFVAEIGHNSCGENIQQLYNTANNRVQQDTNRGFSVYMYSEKLHYKNGLE